FVFVCWWVVLLLGVWVGFVVCLLVVSGVVCGLGGAVLVCVWLGVVVRLVWWVGGGVVCLVGGVGLLGVGFGVWGWCGVCCGGSLGGGGCVCLVGGLVVELVCVVFCVVRALIVLR
ncbi:hypothetical protein, partial [Neisseria sp. P0019.S003]|uniref:hypothetical protein n=1 Tax=Neisseria sp. P0019.S003 TaxID=3436799 RepID=UPI003F7DF5B4